MGGAIRLLCSLLTLVPMHFSVAADEDTQAPQVQHHLPVDMAEKTGPLAISATVTDSGGVKTVELYYRVKGTETFRVRTMNPVADSALYTAVVDELELIVPGLEYYIQAVDQAGNTVQHGNPFSPLSVPVRGAVALDSPPPTAAVTAGSKKPAATSTWVWVAVGVLVTGAIVAAANKDDESSDGGTIVISGPSPWRFF